jgi:DtxR family Mn-dependent transcriptional regulator
MTPAVNLLLTAAAMATLFFLFQPQRGIYWVWARARRVTERVQLEDALKHIYDCHYTGGRATVQSLAGALQVSGNDAAQVSARLEAAGLVTSAHSGLELTAQGRQEALRVIRVHRLWERYLADQTGVDQSEWHARADEVEHRMTAADVEALAERMGDPQFDPHGDPIPSARGEMPARAGEPLNDITPGTWARIVHVEDEPAAVYAQLVAAQLYPGMLVQVLESLPDRIVIEVDQQARILAPVVAANVTVEVATERASRAATTRPLSSLALGEQATVVDISQACQGPERRRLLDLGVVPGTVVTAEMQAFSGDPTAYRIRGAMIALRQEQADSIQVERKPLLSEMDHHVEEVLS